MKPGSVRPHGGRATERAKTAPDARATASDRPGPGRDRQDRLPGRRPPPRARNPGPHRHPVRRRRRLRLAGPRELRPGAESGRPRVPDRPDRTPRLRRRPARHLPQRPRHGTSRAPVSDPASGCAAGSPARPASTSASSATPATPSRPPTPPRSPPAASMRAVPPTGRTSRRATTPPTSPTSTATAWSSSTKPGTESPPWPQLQSKVSSASRSTGSKNSRIESAPLRR